MTFVVVHAIIIHRAAGRFGSSLKGGDAVNKNLLEFLVWLLIVILLMYAFSIEVN